VRDVERIPRTWDAFVVARVPAAVEGPHTAAQAHAVFRADSGFNIEQLASECCALRASALNGWTDACLRQSKVDHAAELLVHSGGRMQQLQDD
jgi:hypothetical protein